MTSACFFKDRLRNDTQVVHISLFNFRQFTHEFSNLPDISNCLTPSTLLLTAGKSKVFPLYECLLSLLVVLPSIIPVILREITKLQQNSISFNINSFNSTHSHVFYMEQSSGEQNPPKNSNLEVFSCTELSGAQAMEVITLSSVASLEPQIATINSYSKEATLHYSYGK